MILDIAATAWRKVATGCRAAFSPDGSAIAYSPDRRSIWTTEADGSSPGERLIKLSEIDGPADDGGGQFGGPISWGEGGIAFTLFSEGKASLVIVDLQGSADIYPLLPPNAGYSSTNLRWQPDGGLLGVFTAGRHNDYIGVVRTFDASRKTSTVLDISRNSSAGILWSPDGDLVLSGGPFDAWQFFDLEGGRVGRLPPPRAEPVDWQA
jgi:WD40 repeat protein